MQITRLTIFWILLFSVHGTYISCQSAADALKKHIASQHTEKLYVANNKPFYLPEETIYGSVFLVDGTDHLLIEGDIICTIELIDDKEEIVRSIDIKLYEGRGAFSIKLDIVTPPGNYSMRAYTQYQRSSNDFFLFQKEIRIVDNFNPPPVDSSSRQVQKVNFFPEGGYLIEGVNSKVAFHALDNEGQPININGTIEDDKGNYIGPVSTQKDGMGAFSLRPASDKTYYVAINNQDGSKRNFQLPDFLDVGHTISINNTREDKIIIDVLSSAKEDKTDLTLIGHARGIVFLDKIILATEPNRVIIAKSELPSGVLHFTLFDSDNRPLAERLAFNANQSKVLNIKVDVNDSPISVSSLTNLKVNIDSTSEGQNGTAAISIYNTSIKDNLKHHSNINNYLLLQSDLRGKILNVDDYFDNNNAESRYLLDIIMMTNGWRRFKWLDILDTTLRQTAAKPYQYSTIKGKIKSTKKIPCSEVNIELNSVRNDFLQSVTTISENNCEFRFDEVDLSASSTVILKAYTLHHKKDKRVENYEINIQSLSPRFDSNNSLLNYNVVATTKDVIAKPSDVNEERILNESLWSFELENVVIKSSYNKAQKLRDNAKARYEKIGVRHISSSQKFDPTRPEFEIYRHHTIYEMIQHVGSGIKLRTKNGLKELTLGSINSPNATPVFVDGIEVNSIVLEAMDPESIAVIDVVGGVWAPIIYGYPSVISLLTKNPEEMITKRPGLLKLQLPGYHHAVEYFDANPVSAEPLISDLRSCLYWNPNVSISQKPQTLSFKTSELIGDHVVKIEGITQDGNPFFQLIPFVVTK